jgi:hypothetical protein
MGQTHTTSAPGGAAGCASLGMPVGPPARNFSGSAWNFARHFMLQKWKVWPRKSQLPPRGAFGFTSMPQTGSRACGGVGGFGAAAGDEGVLSMGRSGAWGAAHP